MQPTSMFCEEQEQAAVAKGVDFFLNKLKRAKVHRTKRDKHLKNLGLTQFKGKVSENEQNIFARMLKQQKLQKRKLRNAASSDLNDIGNDCVRPNNVFAAMLKKAKLRKRPLPPKIIQKKKQVDLKRAITSQKKKEEEEIIICSSDDDANSILMPHEIEEEAEDQMNEYTRDKTNKNENSANCKTISRRRKSSTTLTSSTNKRSKKSPVNLFQLQASGEYDQYNDEVYFYLNHFQSSQHTKDIDLRLQTIFKLIELFTNTNFPISSNITDKFNSIVSRTTEAIFTQLRKEIKDGKEPIHISISSLYVDTLTIATYLLNVRNDGSQIRSIDFIKFAIKILKNKDILTKYHTSRKNENIYYRKKFDMYIGKNNFVGDDQGNNHIINMEKSSCILNKEHVSYANSNLPCIDILFLTLLSVYEVKEEQHYKSTSNRTREFYTLNNNDNRKMKYMTERNKFQHAFRDLGGISVLLPYIQTGLEKFSKLTLKSRKKSDTDEVDIKVSTQSLLRMNMSLKLLENLSFGCNENQKYMSESNDLLNTLMKTLLIGSQLLTKHTNMQTSMKLNELIQISIENTFRVLINITNDNLLSAEALSNILITNLDEQSETKYFSGMETISYVLETAVDGKRCDNNDISGSFIDNGNTERRLQLIKHINTSRLVSYFDMSLLALALLGNCLEHHETNRIACNTICTSTRRKNISLPQYLVNLFIKCCLSNGRSDDFDNCDETMDCKVIKSKDENQSIAVDATMINEHVDVATPNDNTWSAEALVLAGHIALILGCFIKSDTCKHTITQYMPNKSLAPLHAALNAFIKFQSDAGVLTISMVRSIASVQKRFVEAEKEKHRLQDQ